MATDSLTDGHCFGRVALGSPTKMTRIPKRKMRTILRWCRRWRENMMFSRFETWKLSHLWWKAIAVGANYFLPSLHYYPEPPRIQKGHLFIHLLAPLAHSLACSSALIHLLPGLLTHSLNPKLVAKVMLEPLAVLNHSEEYCVKMFPLVFGRWRKGESWLRRKANLSLDAKFSWKFCLDSFSSSSSSAPWPWLKYRWPASPYWQESTVSSYLGIKVVVMVFLVLGVPQKSVWPFLKPWHICQTNDSQRLYMATYVDGILFVIFFFS